MSWLPLARMPIASQVSMISIPSMPRSAASVTVPDMPGRSKPSRRALKRKKRRIGASVQKYLRPLTR